MEAYSGYPYKKAKQGEADAQTRTYFFTRSFRAGNGQPSARDRPVDLHTVTVPRALDAVVPVMPQ